MPLGAHVPAVAGWGLTVLLVLAPAAGYLSAARARRAAGRRWPRGRAVSFLVGLVLVAVAVSPPMQALGHHDPRGHMIQHLLLGMFAPLALVLAAPVTLLLGSLPVARRRTVSAVLRSRVVHGLAHPATAGALDMGTLYLLYLTPLYAVAAHNAVVHQLVNVHFLLAGCLFAWSIAGPDPAPRRPGIGIRVAVLIVAGAAHGYLAKLLHARAAELPPGVVTDAERMQAAAQLMYYGGDLAELALAVALFAAWYRRRPRPGTGRTAPRRDTSGSTPRSTDRGIFATQSGWS